MNHSSNEKNKIVECLKNSLRHSVSAHNSQPFQLKYFSEDKIEVWAMRDRLLGEADNENKAFYASLGTLFESISLSLCKLSAPYDVALVDMINIPNEIELLSSIFLVAVFKIYPSQSRTDEDKELCQMLEKRFSHRGEFEKLKYELPALIDLQSCRIHFIQNKMDKKNIAKIYDEINYKFLSKKNYAKELYTWMRLFSNHKNWSTDGLNRQALNLSLIEAIGAKLILSTFLHGVLKKIKMLKPILSEMHYTAHAPAIAVITGQSTNAFDAGRGMMRGWLALTKLGLYGSSMSALLDTEFSRTKILTYVNSSDIAIYGIFRVGHLPADKQFFERIRLPSEITFQEIRN